MPRKILFGLTLLTLLAAAPAFAGGASAAPAATPPSGIAPAAPAGCSASLDVLAPAPQASLCAAPTAQPASDVPEFLVPSKRLGYCHCGCSTQRVCHTSDDCGGASCDQFISCC
jgi:hypothetical protein